MNLRHDYTDDIVRATFKLEVAFPSLAAPSAVVIPVTMPAVLVPLSAAEAAALASLPLDAEPEGDTLISNSSPFQTSSRHDSPTVACPSQCEGCRKILWASTGGDEKAGDAGTSDEDPVSPENLHRDFFGIKPDEAKGPS